MHSVILIMFLLILSYLVWGVCCFLSVQKVWTNHVLV